MFRQLLLGSVLLMQGTFAYGGAALYHVAPDGGSWPCGGASSTCRSISEVTSNTPLADITIRLAMGNYTGTAIIDASKFSILNISGGWNTDFSHQACNPESTVLEGQVNSSVMHVTASAFTTIELDLSCFRIKGTLTTSRNGIDLSAYGGNIVLKAQQLVFEHIAGIALDLYSEQGGGLDVALQKLIFRDAYQPEGSAKWSGGAIHSSGYGGSTQTITLDNSLLYENSAMQGAAIQVRAANPAPASAATIDLFITNSTIVDNHSISDGGDGGAIYVIASDASQATVHLKNAIIRGNDIIGVARDFNISSFDTAIATVNASYSDIGEVFIFGSSGVYNDNGNNLDVNPVLDSRYHLADNSPLIDKAQCGYTIFNTYQRVAPYDDIDGEKRPGFGVISGCDMGADETSGGFCVPFKTPAGKVGIFCL